MSVKLIGRVFCLSLFILTGLHRFGARAGTEQQAGPIAAYKFDDGSGDRVADSSGNHNDGLIVGGATWTFGIRGRALAFNGRNSVRIPSSPMLDRQAPLSIAAWVQGKASAFRVETGLRGFRPPYFQVCGDRIYLTTNTDYFTYKETFRDGKRVLTPTMERPATMWTGTADISLTEWQYRQRTEPPFSGIEPKLQVVGDEIYYEYFGLDEAKKRQIWTAQSGRDGSAWRMTRRTDIGGAEQDNNIQVVRDRMYMAYPMRNATRHFDLWTASHRTDGSDYHAVLQIPRAGVPALQVVDSTIYYLFPQYAEGYWVDPSLRYQLLFASSALDGSNWKIIKKIAVSHTGGGNNCGAFQISNGRVYLLYSQLDADPDGTTWAHLYSATMNLDGSDFRAIRRTDGQGYVGAAKQGVQVVGHKVHYLFQVRESRQTLKQMAETNTWGEGQVSVWSAESELDGSNWKAIRRDSGHSAEMMATGYKGIQVVGSRTYMGLMLTEPQKPMLEAIGVAGANIASKGDAYGLGLTEGSSARAFVNAGEDYLYRGEAPWNVGGATADSDVDDSWHYLVMTYDGNEVRLYIDGALRARSPYNLSVGRNPFPLVIGDGFTGIIDEVAIYDRTLTPSEISAQYNDRQRSVQ